MITNATVTTSEWCVVLGTSVNCARWLTAGPHRTSKCLLADVLWFASDVRQRAPKRQRPYDETDWKSYPLRLRDTDRRAEKRYGHLENTRARQNRKGAKTAAPKKKVHVTLRLCKYVYSTSMIRLC